MVARAPSAPPQVAELGALAVGAQVAGVILAAGYLLGLVQGPVIAVVGGLALIAFGRAVFLDRAWAAVTGVAIAVLAGALGVGALRWDALELKSSPRRGRRSSDRRCWSDRCACRRPRGSAWQRW